jgi:uncharacterized membrane protein YbhN (UPF0104 family)
LTASPEREATSVPRLRRSRAWACVKWAAGLGILVWLCLHNADDLVKIADSPKDWRYLLLALAVIAASNVVMFGRWWLLVRAQQFPFRLRDAIRYGFAGLTTNFIVPGAVGGDLLKALLLVRDQASRRAAAAATVVVDRLLGLLGLFVLGALAAFAPHDLSGSPAVKANTVVLWAGSAAGLAVVALLLVPRSTAWVPARRFAKLPLVGPALGDLIEGMNQYRSRPATVAAALGLSLVNNSGMILGLYYCARAMQPLWIPSLAAHFYFRPTAELFAALSMIPGGFGAREFAVQEAYVVLNPGAVSDDAAAAAGLAAALAFRVVSLSVALAGLFLCLLLRRHPAR